MARAECIIALDVRGVSFSRRLARKLPDSIPRKWLSLLPAGTAATEDCTLEVAVGAEPVETRAGFRSGKEDFFQFLADRFYAGVLEQGDRVTLCRYHIVGLLDEPLGSALPMDLALMIREFHRERSLLPLEIEAVLVLPGLNASSEAKACAYAQLKELNHAHNQCPSGKPAPMDFIWVADPARSRSEYSQDELNCLLEAMVIYLSTEAHQELHQQVAREVHLSPFLKKPSVASSFGLGRLHFPQGKWIDLLGAVLSRDILSAGPLAPLKVDGDRLRAWSEKAAGFLEEQGLESRVREILLHTESVRESPEFDAWLRDEKNEEEDLPAQLSDRVRLILKDKADEVWGMRDYGGYAKRLGDKVRSMAEAIMEESSKGLLEAELFLSLLLEEIGPPASLVDFGKEDLNAAAIKGVPSLFFGRPGLPSLFQERTLGQVADELRGIYSRRFIRREDSKTWGGLSSDLGDLLRLETSAAMLKDDQKRIQDIFSLAEAGTRAQGAGQTGGGARAWLDDFIKVREQGALRDVVAEAAVLEKIEERIADVVQRMRAAGWKMVLPLRWGPLVSWGFYRWRRSGTVKKVLRLSRRYFEEMGAQLPNMVLGRCYDSVMQAIREVREEVQGFISELREEVRRVEEFIGSTTFRDDSITCHVAKKDDLESLYFHSFQAEDLFNLFERFHAEVSAGGPVYSVHYRQHRRAAYLTELKAFSRYQFAWLLAWNAEDVMLHLNRSQEALTHLCHNTHRTVHFEKYPEDHLRDCLYIGLEEEKKTKLSCDPNVRCLRGNYQFYSTGDKEWISGLRLSHGHTFFSLEGVEHLRQCYQQTVLNSRKMHLDDSDNLEEIFPK
jgi:hypothetical protein